MKLNKNQVTSLCCLFVSLSATVLYVVFEIGAHKFNWIVFMLLLTSCVANALPLFFKWDWTTIVSSIGGSVSLMLFIIDSIGSLSDYFNGIVMFGNPAEAPMIFTICGILLVQTILSLVNSFMSWEKTK
ncbi:MAG: hypothetical protein J6R37_00335 [Clostridia bacterium]|nr:hypothetical protein [Clostridia bacterium]